MPETGVAVGSFLRVLAMLQAVSTATPVEYTHHPPTRITPLWMEREIFDDQLRDMKALGEEIDDCFMSNYHLSTRYKREKFRQRVNGIKLSTR